MSAPGTAFSIVGDRDTRIVLADACSAQAAVLWIDENGQRGAGELVADADGVFLRSQDQQLPTGRVQCSFALYDIPICLGCQLDAGRIVGSVDVWSSEARSATRVEPTQPLEFEWVGVEEPDFPIRTAPLLDLGTNGARILQTENAAAVPRGPFAAAIVIGERRVPCMAEVQAERATQRGIECGLKITPADANEIADTVIRTRFPQVTFRRNVSAAQLDSLFEKSGYVGLREMVGSSSDWATIAEDELTRDLVYVAKDGEVIAHGSVSRAYSKTWLGHQTAMISNHRESVPARSLLTALTMSTTLIDGPETRLLAYYDPSIPYGRVFFEQFTATVRPELAVLADLDWYERTQGAALDGGPPTASQIEVGRASERELIFATALARKHLPKLTADALDLHPALLRSAALHPAYAASAGLDRSRDVLVARIQGRIVGAALCELTTRHLSRFNTFNIAQFFFTEGLATAPARRALLHHVLRYYAERGISDPFVVSLPGAFDAAVDPENKLKMHIRCVAWSFEGIRIYENYLRLRCAWLERGRRARLRPRSTQATASEA